MRVPIEFSTAGEITAQARPGDEDQLAYSLLYGINDPILAPSVDFGSATITVTAAADDPMDVSGDGRVTLVDALMVINRLMERTETANLTMDAREYDVNGDDAITANDALILINFVNTEQARGQAIAELLSEEDDRRSSDDADLRWAIDDAQWSIDPESSDMLS
jgi:hypothetical protein